MGGLLVVVRKQYNVYCNPPAAHFASSFYTQWGYDETCNAPSVFCLMTGEKLKSPRLPPVLGIPDGAKTTKWSLSGYANDIVEHNMKVLPRCTREICFNGRQALKAYGCIRQWWLMVVLAPSCRWCERDLQWLGREDKSFHVFISGISTNEGMAFKESKSINVSLSTLGKVIQCLTSEKPGHIPYRESKLTRLLQVRKFLIL